MIDEQTTDTPREIGRGRLALVDRYPVLHRWLVGLATSIVRDRALAEDIAQDSWLTLLAHPAAPETPTPAWLRRVTLNAAYDAVRRRGRTPALTEPDTAVGSDNPVACVLDAELRARVGEALQRLPNEYRSAWELRAHGCSYEEGASLTDCPVRTFSSRLWRARDRLRAELKFWQEAG